MTAAPDLRERYLDYLACLNSRDWSRLGEHVAPEVVHNGRAFGLAGYRAMLEDDVRRFPDLRFDVRLLAVEGDLVAARLWFDLEAGAFPEHVFYRWVEGRIAEVWSLVTAP
jgi:predicted ester cyclase